MPKVFVTSDTHFGHDRGFLYGPRGFENIEDHDEAVIANWNSVVSPEDDVYVLGDLMLNDNEHGIECIKRLNGNLHIIYGNHDSAARQALYNDLGIIHGWADVIKYKKIHFYLSHYPTFTGNLDEDKPLKCRVINLCGHSHTSDPFSDMNKGLIYHIELDAHNNFPKNIDNIIEDIKNFLDINDQLN